MSFCDATSDLALSIIDILNGLILQSFNGLLT